MTSETEKGQTRLARSSAISATNTADILGHDEEKVKEENPTMKPPLVDISGKVLS
jgi:hypothetical protein